jgi:hypothetical protein
LNAFTAPQFIEWVETKLTQHLGSKRWMPNDDVLADAYRRALAVATINKAIEEATETAVEQARSAKVPKGLRQQLQRALKDSPQEAWDKALYEMVAEETT